MEFYDVINSRRTIRDFKQADIDDEIIKKIISAGMKAPTNDHMRDWHFIVIKDRNVVTKLIGKIPEKVSKEAIEAVLRDWGLNDTCQQNLYKDAIPKQYRMFYDASCVIVPVFRQKTDILHPENLSHLNGFASIWCCIENMFLAATAEGYACTLRIPLGNEGEWAREVLKFPDDYLMPCFIAVGKKKDGCREIEQKEICVEERIHNNTWQ
ncbi:MAG: nitroreductase family protein [Oscillospiraceae bacterium]|nr:nitroreductase family protein [Oscillospiraceae bacterium]